jgi:AraC-like DNA-binding protein
MQRVIELRLQKARALLSRPANDRLRIGDVAERSGFADESYFIKRFRARFGSSPGAFRQG